MPIGLTEEEGIGEGAMARGAYKTVEASTAIGNKIIGST
jgi:hypothetical protein